MTRLQFGKRKIIGWWIMGLVALMLPVIAWAVWANQSAWADDQERSDRPREGARAREGDGDRKRDGEQRREGERRATDRPRGDSPEARDRKRGDRREGGYRPQTDREAQLFQIILRLQRDVEALRREVAAMRGDRGDREVRREGDREVRHKGDRPTERSARDGDRSDREQTARSRIGKIFAAYDKNKDRKVGFEEWLAMKEGDIDDARRARERQFFSAADRNRDGALGLDEFAAYFTRGRRESEGPQRGPRDGGGEPKRGPRDGERGDRPDDQ